MVIYGMVQEELSGYQTNYWQQCHLCHDCADDRGKVINVPGGKVSSFGRSVLSVDVDENKTCIW